MLHGTGAAVVAHLALTATAFRYDLMSTLTEESIKETTDKMVGLGLVELGCERHHLSLDRSLPHISPRLALAQTTT